MFRSPIAGLGKGVAAWLQAPNSANLADAITDETGTGALVFATSPTLVTPNVGAATATTINGVAIDNNAFAAYTPTITATSGTFTTVSATGAWRELFGKVVFYRATVTITTIGTAAGRMLVSIPSGTVAAIGAGSSGGFNGSTSEGLMGVAYFDSNSTISFNKTADASFPGTSGQTLYVSGWYQKA